MRKILFTCGSLTLLLPALTLSGLKAGAATYYISNAGRDANVGTTAATPWKSITKLNAALLAAHPGDTFLLKRGDVFRDAYIFCGSQYANAPGQTRAANPPKCSGSARAPITIGAYGSGPNPYINAADALTGKWTPMSATTYQLHLPSGEPLPLKLFVDPNVANALGQQILPVPNFVGPCSPTTTYNYLDMWQATPPGPTLAMEIGPTPAKGCGGLVFLSITAATSTTAVQGFLPGNTGIQNVQAGAAAFVPMLKGFGYPTYPGVWYVTGSPSAGYTIYLNLADGSNPNAHTIEATHRNYGVFIEGTNFVTVEDLTIAHSFETCALGAPYSDADPVEQHITFQRLRVFNCASMGSDFLTTQQSHLGHFGHRGGIVIRASEGFDPPNVLLPAILDSYVGTVDTYFGTDTLYASGILMDGVDGGGPANACLMCGNFVSTSNSPGLNLTINLYAHTLLSNNGGRVANNELTNNQSNIGFASIRGGLLDHNYVHESYGQGAQLGGSSVSVDGGPSGPVPGSQRVEYNTFVNLGQNATRRLFNGIDCNSDSVLLSGLYEIGNTITNAWGAGVTFEGKGTGTTGCTAAHFWNNVIDQHYNYFGNGTGTPNWTRSTAIPNNSNVMYLTNALHKGFDFRNNFYRASAAQKIVVHTNNPSYTCEKWVAEGPDIGTTCDGTDPLFAHAEKNDFRLQPSSPLRAKGRNGLNIGAFPDTNGKLPFRDTQSGVH